MRVTPDPLTRLRRYESPATGISEEFLALPGASAAAILSSPLACTRGLGFVVCRSPGPEQGPLRRLEALVARTLAAAGFPVLRLRRSGENELLPQELSLSAALAEAERAVEALDDAGVERVGTLGGLVGGSVAMLLAARLGLELVAMWEPVCRGSDYLRELRKKRAFDALAREQRATVPPAGGMMIRSFLLRDEAHEELAALDLGESASGFRGDSLILAISGEAHAGSDLVRLAEQLERAGGRPTLELLQGSLAVPFGEPFVRTLGDVKADTRIEVDLEIARLTASWALQLAEAPVAR